MSTTREKVAALLPLVDRMHRGHHWRKDKAGNMACIKEPLDDFKLAQHCAGREAYGLCPIVPGESTCRVALLDLDSHGGETPFDEMVRVAREVMGTAALVGLNGVAFRSSGGRGVHVYFLFDAPQDAHSVRETLKGVLAACGLDEGAGGVAAGQCEIFPKQSGVAPDGFGNMFVLALAGKSVLLDDEGNPLPRDAILQLEWPMSDPVPLVVPPPKPERPAVDLSTPDTARLRSALAAIPNDGEGLPYDQWLRVVFGTHYATGGSAEGLALIHEFSARSAKYDPDFLDEKVLRYVNDGREGEVITERTLYAMAASHGWQDPAIADDFAVVEAAKPLPLPAFVRNRSGDILSTDDNVAKALRRPDVCGYRIGFDTFRDELMLAPENTEEWRSFSDADYTRLSITLERRGFKTTSADRLRSCVRLVADEHRFDSATVWLNSLEWDGKPRIAQFLTEYAGVEEASYTCAVSLYLFTAMAGRVLAPGCKADMVPVLVGPQGTGKSSLVAALVLAPEHFVEVSFHEDENTLARKMRGRLLGEIAELRGLRTKELEAIKAFITRTHENWVPKWQEFAKTFPRRLVFVGTTNADEFLADETGNRRWLPVRVGRIDIEGIRRDRLQLWAEARERYQAEGILFHGAEQLAGEAHRAHTITDAWEAHVAAWLAAPTAERIGMDDENTLNGERPFRLGDVLGGALGLQARDQDTARQLRAGRVLRKLGYGDKQMTVDGVRAKFWMRREAA